LKSLPCPRVSRDRPAPLWAHHRLRSIRSMASMGPTTSRLNSPSPLNGFDASRGDSERWRTQTRKHRAQSSRGKATTPTRRVRTPIHLTFPRQRHDYFPYRAITCKVCGDALVSRGGLTSRDTVQTALRGHCGRRAATVFFESSRPHLTFSVAVAAYKGLLREPLLLWAY